MSRKMKAALLYGKSDLRIEEIPIPTPAAGEAPGEGSALLGEGVAARDVAALETAAEPVRALLR